MGASTSWSASTRQEKCTVLTILTASPSIEPSCLLSVRFCCCFFFLFSSVFCLFVFVVVVAVVFVVVMI